MFGAVEYWLSLIKIVAITAFIILAVYVIVGADSFFWKIGVQKLYKRWWFFP